MTMGNGMSFKAGRDMPPGMQEKMAMKMVAELQKKNGVPSDDVQRAQTRQTVTMTANNERMVSASKLIILLAKRFRNKGMVHYDDLMAAIADVPTVDAVEVVHGRWVDNGIPESMLSKCSVCGFPCGAYSFNYCPNCGAKMDEERR